MTKREFYNKITNSKKDFLSEFLQILHKNNFSYCVIGGIGINAYCEPIITLDFDCVVVADKVKQLIEKIKKSNYKVKKHLRTFEIKHKNSDIRIQIQRDERFQGFIKNAQLRPVMGYNMRIARKEDILQSKICAYEDPQRDELKRIKDFLDIKRLINRFPRLEKFLPEKLKA